MNALLNPEALLLPRRTTADEVFSLHASSVGDPKVRKFKQLLVQWFNSYLREEKIYVRDLVEDLHDGQLLLAFLEKIFKTDLGVHVGGTSETSKRENLNMVLKVCRERLGLTLPDGIVDGVIEKDFVSIARLCVQLAHKLKCPYQLPSNIEVVVVHRESMKSGSMTKTSRYPITGNESSYGSLEADLIHGMQGASLDGKTSDELFTTHERDAIDELFEPHNAEKLQAVKTLLSAFVNKHLASCGLQVNDLMNQFHDGVYLVILVGALGKFFVPLYNYKIAPTTTDEKIANVNYSFKLMLQLNIPKGHWKAEEVVRREGQSTVRILHSIFTAFKNAPA